MRVLRLFRWALAAFAILFAPASSAQNRNDHQIEWMVSAQDWRDGLQGTGHNYVSFNLKARPARLYVAASDVIGENGEMLLPAGAQFYGMTDDLLTACSQERGPEGTPGYENRVCLRDEDADGTPDAYWFRAFGRSFLRLDNWWFAMNSKLPRRRMQLTSVELDSVNPSQANLLLDMELRINRANNGTLGETLNVDSGDRFNVRCLPATSSELSDGSELSFCLMPDLVVIGRNSDAPDPQDRQLDVLLPERDTPVFFVMSSGLIAGRNMAAIVFR